MSRKQNSLMRFSRTERLAQLSEQEVVIERKKREIQAKLEAQRKKETEEAFRKLEASSKEKNNDLNYSRKNSLKRDGGDKDKYIESEKQDSLKNAFSNDGSFLDHFKKISQTNFSSNSANFEKHIQKKKNFDGLDDYRQNQDAEQESHCARKSLNSNIQLQLPPPGIVQLVPQHQVVPIMQPLNQNSLSVPSPSVHVSAMQPIALNSVPQFTTNEIQLKAIYSSPFSQSTQSTNSTSFSNLKTSSVVSVEKSNETEKNSCTPSFKKTSIHQSFYVAPQTSSASSFAKPQNNSQKHISPISKKKAEPISKGHTDSVSMTFKNNTTKKLEIIANPLGDDDEDDDVLDTEILKKSAQIKFEEAKKKNIKDFHHNLEQQNLFSFSPQNEEFSRISPAFFNGECEFGGKEWNQKIEITAKAVAQCGDEFEEVLRKCNENEPSMRFLTDKNSKAYLIYREKVQQHREQNCKEEKSEYFDKQGMQLQACNDKDIVNEKNSNDKLDSLSLKTQMQEKSFSKFNDGYQGDNEEESKSYKCSEKNKSQKSENSVAKADPLKVEERHKRKRKSRWGDMATNSQPSALISNLNLQSGKFPPPKTNLLSQLTRSDPGLIQYAKQTFGSANLSEEDWKKAEDHYKINLLYQDLIKKRAEIKKLEKAGKFKYEYDSDEDVEGGTWEHKLRQQEMMATQLWAEELTRQAAGKHHIGDFLPPEELERFMEKYNAVKEGREPDLSDYKEFKLKEDNVGYRLLQKMGWNEGQGLGQDGSGMTHPVNKAATRHENQGLGLERPDGLEAGDDEYDAYRKRMMLAYRFRPNPLNNPRRPYY